MVWHFVRHPVFGSRKAVKFLPELSELLLLYLGIAVLVLTLRFLATNQHLVINVTRKMNVWKIQVTFIIKQNLIWKQRNKVYICLVNTTKLAIDV